jgi:surface antigen
MPLGGSELLYRDMNRKNRWDFSILLTMRNWGRVIVLSTLSLCGCVELAGPLNSVTNPKLDFLDVTGSLADTKNGFSLKMIEDADRGRALDALAQALDPMNEGQTSVWTGQSGQIKGTFSARGLAFVQDEQICRDFIAAIERRSSVKETAKVVGRQEFTGTEWTGTACRQGLGSWSVIDRPHSS